MANLSDEAKLLKEWFPFTKAPFVANAPMWEIATQALATGVSKAGGLGFIGAGPSTKPIRGYLDGVDKVLRPEDYTHSQICEALHPEVPLDPEDYNPKDCDGFSLPLEAFNLAEDEPVEDEPVEAEDEKPLLEVGVGIICFVADLKLWIDSLKDHTPCAVWLFGPRNDAEFVKWINTTKETYPRTKLFCQIGSVTELTTLLRGDASENVDAIVAQGVADAGGHGINQGASIVGLIPQFLQEIQKLKDRGKIAKDRVIPVLAAGGIMDGRGCAAALALGAAGVVLGTRFILSTECSASDQHKNYLAEIVDGGQQTVRTRLYDTLRGNGAWAPQYNGRSVRNDSYHAFQNGMSEMENRELYKSADSKENKDWNRLTVYCGTGVGLVSKVKTSKEIAEEIRTGAIEVLRNTSQAYRRDDDDYTRLQMPEMTYNMSNMTYHDMSEMRDRYGWRHM